MNGARLNAAPPRTACCFNRRWRRRGLLAETDPLLQRWQRFAAAINRTFRLAESLKNAATPESLLCRCEDVRCGDVAAADDWLQAKLTSARWLYGWPLPQPREPLSPRPRGNAYLPSTRLSAEP